MKIHKLLLVVKLSIFYVLATYSQNYNFDEELRRVAKVPNTPEAEAFAKYGNTEVNMYTGTPNISVPIYTINGNELSLPISLSYDASGVKVSQLATGVGLNWNLNAGGRISRVVNGLVDDYLSVSNNAYPSVLSPQTIYFQGVYSGMNVTELIAYHLNPPNVFDEEQDVIDYFQFMKDIGDNKLDTQPDYFSFSALGISDYFVLDIDTASTTYGTYRALDNPRIKASVTYNLSPKYIMNWVITNEDGTKFHFNAPEKTKTIGPDINGSSSIVQDYYSSWALTKIESPNLTDTYEFIYEDFNGVLINNQPLITTATISNELDNPNPNTASHTSVRNTEYKLSQRSLVSIKHNGKVVVDIDLKSRSDFNLASAIDKINIRNYNDTAALKTFKFNHSYFGVPSINDFSQRLKLDNIEIKAVNTVLSTYEFEYFSPSSVPSRGSLARDFLGYNNGQTGNNTLNVLYPEISVDGITLDGANRDPDFDDARKGTLKKITYPTGGSSEFIFEPNKTPYTTQDINASVQDVSYAYLNVSGGVGSNNGCGACCIDQYGQNPNINGAVFVITDAGNYNITFNNDSGSHGEAYLFKRTTLFKPNATPWSYDQVINQSTCGLLVNDLVWSNFYGGNGNNIYLSSGTYQITLAKGPNLNSGSNNINLRIHRDEIVSNGTVGTGEVIRAGFRIKSIKDFASSGVLATEKEYIYKTTINGNDSSGETLFNPAFYTIHDYTMFSQEAIPSRGIAMGVNERRQIRRSNSWSGGNRPFIAYSKVFERQKGSGEENGFIEHNFNIGINVGVFSSGVSPNVNLYNRKIEDGKESSSVVYKDLPSSSNTEAVSSSQTEYDDVIHFGNSTMYVYNDPMRNYQFVKIYEDQQGKFHYSFTEARMSGFSGYYAPGTNVTATQPSDCDVPNTCLPLEYSTFKIRNTYSQGKVGGVVSNTKKQFFQNDTLTTVQQHSYDGSIDHLLRETKTYTSNKDSILTKYYYTKDKSGTSVYNDMISKNMLSNVVKTEAFKNNAKLGVKEIDYKKWSTSVYKPERIKTAKGTLGLDERMKIYSYDSKGNPREVGQTDGSHTVYIWGYNKEYLVAKVENATCSAIEGLSYFSTGLNVTNGLSANQENSLLNNLPNALVTIYRYTDPRNGVSSIIDPNGYVTTYEYDEFNRLARVKDSDGKILSENEYNYKN